jgi:hypothetical protein
MYTAYGGSIDFEEFAGGKRPTGRKRTFLFCCRSRRISGSKRGVHMKARPLWLIAAFVLLSSSPSFATSASLYYSDGPWMGRIIDAETKEPIEGAVIVAVWEKIYPGITGNYSYFFDAREVLTDREGKFLIKKFKAINVLPVIRWLDGPWFTVFKPGYTPFGASSAGYDYFRHERFQNSPLLVDRLSLAELFKKGVTIELLRLKTKEERLKTILGAEPLGGVPNDKMPILMGFISHEEKELGLDPIPLKGGK